MSTTGRLVLLTALLGVASLIGWNAPLSGQSAKPPVFADFRSKLAIDGHDAVAYFKEGKPLKGSDAHTVTWNGATWRFASAQNKAAFESDPQAYAPQYGGYCAWAVSEGYTAKGDPNHWRIIDNKLYLNYNASVQTSWAKDIPGRIVKGDRNWPTVLGK